MQLIVLFALLITSNALAQDGDNRFSRCSDTTEFVELTIKVQSFPGGNTGPARLLWIVDLSAPTELKIDANEAGLRDRITEELALIRNSGQVIGIGKGGNPEPGDPLQLEVLLATEIGDFRPELEFTPATGLDAAPGAADLGHTFRARLCVHYRHVERPRLVQITVRTRAAEVDHAPEIDLTLADTAQPDLSAFGATIPVRIAFAQQDLDDARTDMTITSEAEARQHVQAELLRVAAAVFRSAVAQQLLSNVGQPLVDTNNGAAAAANTEAAVQAEFNLNSYSSLIAWSNVRCRAAVADAAGGSAPATWTITVTGLELARAVDIVVLKSSEEEAYDGGTVEKALDQNRERTRQQLRTRDLPGLSAKAGRFISVSDIEADLQKLRTDKQLVRAANSVAAPALTADGAGRQQLNFLVSRYLKAEKLLGIHFGGAFAPEDGLMATGSVQESNLLGLGETSSLKLAAGAQVQRLDATFERKLDDANRAGWRISSVAGEFRFARDINQRLGNPGPRKHELRTADATVRATINYNSIDADTDALLDCQRDVARPRTQLHFSATPSFVYSGTRVQDADSLSAVAGIDPALAQGPSARTTTIGADLSLQLSHDFRTMAHTGPGIFTLSADLGATKGMRIFGADFDYHKLRTSIGAEFFFGSLSTRDYVVRLAHVEGRSSSGTPVFELFRVGGPQTVRGIEQGELVGRDLNATQVEFGVNALVAWHLISQRPVNKRLQERDCNLAESGPAPIFDPARIYLKAFFDLARLHDDSSFTNLRPFRNRSSGYGMALELQQLNGQPITLSLGYAYSPNSQLHRSGTLYTGVTYTFR